MKRDEHGVGAGTWALAGLWGVLLVGAPFYMALVRRELEDAGCFAVGREATTPFSLHRSLGTTDMALPLPTAAALAVPVAVWPILAAAIPALLVWKTWRLPHRAATIIDVLAAVGLVAMLGFLLSARLMPYEVVVE
jgi:hypothetical protein